MSECVLCVCVCVCVCVHVCVCVCVSCVCVSCVCVCVFLSPNHNTLHLQIYINFIPFDLRNIITVHFEHKSVDV